MSHAAGTMTGSSQTLYARAEQSGAPAKVGEVAPEISRSGLGQSFAYAQSGVWLFPQAGLPVDAAIPLGRAGFI